MEIQPYLFLDGRCEEAIEFYRSALNAKNIRLVRFKDNPEPNPGMTPPGSENKIMHAAIQIGKSTLLLSDGRCTGKPKLDGFALSLYADTEADADRLFNALAQGGKIQMPLGKTFFSPRFGMVADQFGVSWMVIVQP
jgi:PhnB protein